MKRFTRRTEFECYEDTSSLLPSDPFRCQKAQAKYIRECCLEHQR